ncbi:FAD-binding protein [Arthrobacter sp. zg-Y859]|uniref:FAD-binding protein n=1 Tax=Arthrobacter jinronghuae TaxID=2964609 RepID=A0ABT1NMT4_9MICC|nr:FAD-binding protein [Arthrobacter jinronghuae]MCQ1948372.1 FAD-binding protein [Arthrobacter jinronghuae]UWX78792.1 FAD-binding protein [Arthrobacter jinronghuae]
MDSSPNAQTGSTGHEETKQDEAATELTGAVVIGCGLSGLAVATELCRQGVDSIVVHGPAPAAATIREAASEPEVFPERLEVLRVLHAYAASHRLDVREDSEAQEMTLAAPAGLLPSPAAASGKWAIRTGRELLLADYVVLTSCSRSDLRKLARALGVGAGPEAVEALRGIGVYLVGVGENLLPSLRGLMRQAKAAGEAIADAGSPTPQAPTQG